MGGQELDAEGPFRCPGCEEPVHLGLTGRTHPDGLPAPEWVHEDGSGLCAAGLGRRWTAEELGWCAACRLPVGTDRYRDGEGRERCGVCAGPVVSPPEDAAEQVARQLAAMRAGLTDGSAS